MHVYTMYTLHAFINKCVWVYVKGKMRHEEGYKIEMPPMHGNKKIDDPRHCSKEIIINITHNIITYPFVSAKVKIKQ